MTTGPDHSKIPLNFGMYLLEISQESFLKRITPHAVGIIKLKTRGRHERYPGTYEYRVLKKFQNTGTAGYWVSRKFRHLGTDGYRVQARKIFLGTDG